jgi:hypothetical protein
MPSIQYVPQRTKGQETCKRGINSLPITSEVYVHLQEMKSAM